MRRLLAAMARLDDLVLGAPGHLRPLAHAAATAWPTTLLYSLTVTVLILAASW